MSKVNIGGSSTEKPPHKMSAAERRFALLQATDFDAQNRVEKLLRLAQKQEVKVAAGKMWPGCARLSITFPYTSKSVNAALRVALKKAPKQYHPMRIGRKTIPKARLCHMLRAEADLTVDALLDADLADESREAQIDAMFRRKMFATYFRNALFNQPLDQKESKRLQTLLVTRHADGSESRAKDVFRLFAGLHPKDFGGTISTGDDDDDSDDSDDSADRNTPTPAKKRSLQENINALLDALSGDQRNTLGNIVDEIEFLKSAVDFFRAAADNAAQDLAKVEKELRNCRDQKATGTAALPPTMLRMTQPDLRTKTERGQLSTEIIDLPPPAVPPADLSKEIAPPLPASL